mgnify:CR=1 FL=1
MSRLASKPIIINSGTSCNLEDGNIKISRSGKIVNFPFNKNLIDFKIEGHSALLSRSKENKTPVELNGLLGTTWALFKMALRDIENPYKAKLNFVGVGYKASVVKAGKFNYLKLTLGFSHPIFVFIPEGLNITQDKETIIVAGDNTESVMRFCAMVRSQKKPTVYHGTGVIMNDDIIIKKAGKKK